MRLAPDLGLTSLYARRALAPRRLALFAAALALLAWFGAPSDWVLEVARDPDRTRRALTLQSLWGGGLLLLVPASVLLAAALPAGWRGKEGAWLGSRPGARAAALPAAWLGTLLGALVPVLALALLAELRAGPSGPERVRLGACEGPPRGLVSAEGARWDVELADDRVTYARVEVLLTPGESPFARVRWSARGTSGEALIEQRLAGRGTLELALPPGPGTIACELSRVGDGAPLFVRTPRTQLLGSARGRLHQAAGLFLRVALDLAAWIALALALGSALGGWTAAGLLGSGWLLVWSAEASPRWFPGVELPRTIGDLSSGVASALPEPASWAAAAALVVAGCVAAPVLRRLAGDAA